MNIREASVALAKRRGRAMIVAGGTMVHGLAARGLLGNIKTLIDLQNLGLSYVKSDPKGFRIGAMTTFDEVLNYKPVSKDIAYGALIDAANLPPAQIRNMATLGGSVCSSTPFFDVPIALMALDADVRAKTSRRQRLIPLNRFFISSFETALKAGEIATEVILRKFPSRTASSLLKLETNANDLAILNVGTRITLDKQSRCIESRIVVGGGVGPVPVNSPSAERKLRRRVLDEDTISEASEATLEDVDPVSDFRGSADYRRAMCKVMTKRALKKALARVRGGM